MYGTWFGTTLSVIGGLLLLVALLAGGLVNPIFAILIAVIAVAVAIPLMSRRRAESERSAEVGGGAGGGPVSGEGGEADDGSPEARQRADAGGADRVTEGVWGERREG